MSRRKLDIYHSSIEHKMVKIMTILIRPAIKEDYAALLPIGLETQELHADAHPDIFAHGVSGLPEDDFAGHINSETQIAYVAEVDDTIVGYILLEIRERKFLDMLIPRKLAHIRDLAVMKTHQQQGVGHLLFQQSIEWAKSKGVTSVELTVWEFNQHAIAFYKRQGMETLTRTMSLPLT